MIWDKSFGRKFENAAERWVLKPLVWVTSPVWAPPIALIVGLVVLEDRIRSATHPRRDAHQWFAWRPVTFGFLTDHHGGGAWMQTIWRGRDRWGDTTYAPTRESLETAQ